MLFPGPLTVKARLGTGTSVVQGLFIEALLTAQLMIIVLMLALEKQRATYLVPVAVGVAVFLCELAGMIVSTLRLSRHYSIELMYEQVHAIAEEL